MSAQFLKSEQHLSNELGPITWAVYFTYCSQQMASTSASTLGASLCTQPSQSEDILDRVVESNHLV